MINIVLNQYNSYIKCNLDYLDEIPSHWLLIRIKDVINNIDQGWSPIAENRNVGENEYGVLKLSAISNGIYYELNHKALPEYEEVKMNYIVKKGDLLMTRSNTPMLVGECCLVADEPRLKLMYSDLIYNMKINTLIIDARYLNYFLSSASFRWVKTVSARGLNNSMVKISQGVIKGWQVAYPPVEEQRNIADYLDYATQNIDNRIETLVKKVELYKELQEVLIFEAVTHGLDKAVSMKTSGLEWVDNIPSHWEVVPLRTVVNNINDKNNDNEINQYLSLVSGIGVIPYEEKGNVGNKKPEDISKCKIVYPGDLVINSMNFGIGSFGLSKYKGVCSSVYLVMRPIDKNYEQYLFRLFQTKYFQKYMQSFGKGILDIRMAIKWNDFKNVEIPFPSSEERKVIVDYINDNTQYIDCMIETINQQISALKELRIGLINDTVTGKLKVNMKGENNERGTFTR